MRSATASAKVRFEEVEENEQLINTNLNFISTKGCYCGIQIKKVEKLAIIQNCGHSWHHNCLGKWLSNNNTCPYCRCTVTEISTINRGIETIDKFKESYTIHIGLFGEDDEEDDDEDNVCNKRQKQSMFTPMLTRQYTQSTTLRNSVFTLPLSIFDANMQTNLNGYIEGLKIYPSVPNTFENINSNINNYDKECVAIYSKPFEYNGTSLGTFVISSPFCEKLRINQSDCVFIIDSSGSMEGDPINLSKRVSLKLVSEIPKYFRLSIATFNDSAKQLTPLQQVTEDNKNIYFSQIENIKADNGTNYNHAFSLLSDIYDESGILENINRITIFVTDGQPSDNPDYNIIEKMIAKYPMMKLYFISIGGDINASEVAVKFLLNRHPNLSIYKHCASLDDFALFLPSIFNDVCNIFANEVKITFENVKPISSKAIHNEDGSWVINLPCIFESSAEQFAYECGSEKPKIKVTYNRNGSLVNLSANEDIERSLDKFSPWSLMRSINLKVNTIVMDNNIETSKKREILEEMLTSLDHQVFGEYYQEMYDNLSKIIKTIKMLTTRNYNIDNNLNNSLLESSLNEGSTQRSYSVRLARNISNTRSDHTFDPPFDIIDNE
jgi:uncharacterized protein YegL